MGSAAQTNGFGCALVSSTKRLMAAFSGGCLVLGASSAKSHPGIELATGSLTLVMGEGEHREGEPTTEQRNKRDEQEVIFQKAREGLR